MTVGERIAMAREALGLSKGQFAKKMNVSYQTVSDWEDGKITPRPTRFEKLAKILNAPSDWLILGQGDYSPDDPPTNVCSITAFSAEAAEGYGCPTYVENHPFKRIDINREWLDKNASYTDDNALSIITKQGDSMSPTIMDSDALLLDHSISEILKDGIYATVINGNIYINRFNLRPDGKLIMISDNKAYDSYEVQEADNVEVIGQIILRLTASRL